MNKIQDASGSRVHEKKLTAEDKVTISKDESKYKQQALPKTKAEPVRNLEGKVVHVNVIIILG